MKNIKLSIIVPAYNAERTIQRCLDSLLVSVSQEHVEVICVDDGSQDSTWNILRDYARKFSFIRIFHKTNGGVASARNLGLSKVRGRYVAWIDSDDYVVMDWYEKINIELDKYHPDLLFFDYFSICKGIQNPVHIALSKNVSLYDFIYEQSKERELKNYLWNQVISSDLYDNIRFNEEYHMMEDYDVLTRITPKCKRIRHIRECIYYYVQNSNSLTYNMDLMPADILWMNIAIVRMRYNRYTSIGFSVSINDYLLSMIGYLYSVSGYNDVKKQDRFRLIKKELRLLWQKIFQDKSISRNMKIKVLFGMSGFNDILYILLRLIKK